MSPSTRSSLRGVGSRRHLVKLQVRWADTPTDAGSIATSDKAFTSSRRTPPMPNYRPLAHRTPSFLLLAVVIASLIGLLQHALNTLPHVGAQTSVQKRLSAPPEPVSAPSRLSDTTSISTRATSMPKAQASRTSHVLHVPLYTNMPLILTPNWISGLPASKGDIPLPEMTSTPDVTTAIEDLIQTSHMIPIEAVTESVWDVTVPHTSDYMDPNLVENTLVIRDAVVPDSPTAMQGPIPTAADTASGVATAGQGTADPATRTQTPPALISVDYLYPSRLDSVYVSSYVALPQGAQALETPVPVTTLVVTQVSEISAPTVAVSSVNAANSHDAAEQEVQDAVTFDEAVAITLPSTVWTSFGHAVTTIRAQLMTIEEPMLVTLESTIFTSFRPVVTKVLDDQQLETIKEPVVVTLGSTTYTSVRDVVTVVPKPKGSYSSDVMITAVIAGKIVTIPAAAATAGEYTVISDGTTITEFLAGSPSATQSTVSKSFITFYHTLVVMATHTSAPSPTDPVDSDKPLTLAKVPAYYILSANFPRLAAVVLRLMLGYLYRSTKLMDPFFMLTQKGGAPAYSFLNARYLGNESFASPISALRARRFLLLMTACIYFVAQLLMPFAAELTTMSWTRHITATGEGYEATSAYAFWINPVVCRILQAFLALILTLLVAVWFGLRGRRSGVHSDPSAIATVASLCDHPVVASDFATFAQGDSKKTMARVFAGRRYSLSFFLAGDNSTRYGIVPCREYNVPSTEEDAISLANTEGETSSQSPISRPSSRMQVVPSIGVSARHGKFDLIKRVTPYAIFFGISTALLAVIVAYYRTWTSNDRTWTSNDFESFMDSATFGPRFVLSVLALLIKSSLASIFSRAIAAVPWNRLARQSRHANPDMLTPIPLTPFGAIRFALARREWYVACLAVAAGVVVEALLMLIPGVPFRPNRAWRAAQASWFGCMACLAMLIMVAIAAAVRYAMLGAPEHALPASPWRVGGVCSYLAGSQAVRDIAASLAIALEGVDEEEKGATKGKKDATSRVAQVWQDEVNLVHARYRLAKQRGRLVLDYEGADPETDA